MNVIRAIRSCIFIAAIALFSESSWCAESDNPLLGRWLVQRVGIRDATKLPMKIEWEFTDNQVIVRDVTNKQEISRNSYKIDLMKDPRWITVTVVDMAKEVRPGIFQIVGDELHLKQAVEGIVRPTKLVENSYTILTRQSSKAGQQGSANQPAATPQVEPSSNDNTNSKSQPRP